MNPSAATAAASAFMSATRHNPNKSLSSAAAAAALRARPQTPTNVGEVQTKRTMRRSASMSSSGSAPAGPGGTAQQTSRLERKGSNASMTERTFRSPSPHRSSPAQHVRDEPPVPRIPEGHKKSASSGSVAVGMQTFRTASQRKGSGLPSWYTQPHGDPSNVRTSDAAMAKMSTPKLETRNSMPPRSDSRSSSINYSYPTTFRPQSPPASPTSAHIQPATNPHPRTPASPPRSSKASVTSSTGGRSEPQMVYDPNSRRMVPVPVEEIEYHVREAAERLPRKKKSAGVQRSGSHLAKGTVARPKGTLVEDRGKGRNEPVEEQRVIEAAPVKEQRQAAHEPRAKSNNIERREEKQPEKGDTARSPEPEPEISRLKSPPPQLQHIAHERTSRQPDNITSDQLSTDLEESEEEDVAPITTPLSEKVLSALDSVPTRQKVFEQPRTAPTPIPEEGDALPEQPPGPSQTPAETEQAEPESRRESGVFENKPILELSQTGSNLSRSSSNSPVRQARFTSSPPASLSVRHNPLPRSASPIKPALKQSGSTREVSPSEAGPENAANRDASPNVHGETPIQRKKSVRVSFDDQNTRVVGESAPSEDVESPSAASPQQAKRPWYSNIGRGKRREITLEDDEIMKPRPALPSFGSIRERKTRPPEEERPLVRPYEPAKSPSAPSSPSIQPNDSSTSIDINDSQTPSLSQSSDQAIGAVLSQEQASRIPANISRFREPLPPVVTSAEGLEYTSDTTLDSDQENVGSSIIESDAEVIPSTQTSRSMRLETRDNSQDGTTMVEDKVLFHPEETTRVPSTTSEIPEISVIQPSPMIPEAPPKVTNQVGSAEGQYFDVPGGFPMDNGSDENRATKTGADAETKTDVTSQPAAVILEPAAEIQPTQTESLPQTTLVTTSQPPVAAESEDESDESSIYSDAYEDLSDIEGPGFLSLDAVVDSPATKVTSKLRDMPATLVEGAENEPETPPATTRPITSIFSQLPPHVDDWEQAKSYWRSLTAEKRQQLEREALEDAGADGDREEVALPVRRNSSRRKLAEQKQSDQKQPEADVKPQTAPSSKSAKQADLDRTYMIQPGSKANHAPVSPKSAPRMRDSLREQPTKETQPQASTHMRKSMRSGPEKQPAKQASSRSVISKKERPMSMPSNTTSLNAAGSALSKQSNPPLERRGSDASDSSFKRSRPTTSGGLSFRKTMRQPEAAGGSSRFSLRSLSPSDSSLRRNSVMSTGSAPPVGTMRRTLRSGSESSHEGKSSSHFPSFGRSNKTSSSKKVKKSSRFGDDSDEDDVGTHRFRSRFDDSSDEEEIGSSPLEGGVLAKGTLRGPATASTNFKRSPTVPEAVEESPELPDSDDDMPAHLRTQQHHAAARTALGRTNSESLGTGTLSRSRSGRGGFDATIQSAPTSPKRGSIMGILRRNKKADLGGKIQRSDLTESAARRDTKLERNADQLRDIRGDSRPTSPKLQKRNGTLKRGDSWPVPEDVQRPGTSAGNILVKDGSVTGSTTDQRPTLAGRRSTSLGISGGQDDELLTNDNVIVASDSQKKKKKFGALRRMFHLDN